MNSFRIKYLTYLLSFSLITGAGIGALLYYYLQDYYPQWYVGILSFLFLFESLVICIVDSASKKLGQRKLANLYLLLKVVKILSSLAFVGIYAINNKEGIRSFVLVFVFFYFLFLLFDTLFFSRVEKRLKAGNNTK